ncbi:MAG TPA: hypothetical protein VGL86_19455 [Polyangia bacterium]
MLRAALACALLIGAAGARAGADEAEPPVGLAVGTGTGVALVTMLAGGVLYATNNDNGLRRTAAYVAFSGLLVAPIAAHLVVREYKRAAIFAALPLAAFVANAAVFAVDPQVTTYGSASTRVTFGIALTAATVGATVGLADCFGAGERWHRRHRVMLAPAIGPSTAGVALGAKF